jgi:hypothetical protein
LVGLLADVDANALLWRFLEVEAEYVGMSAEALIALFFDRGYLESLQNCLITK